jgi:hypothetical protein
MRTKFKILMCTLFLLGFAVSQVHAQYAFRLGARTRTVAQYGHNQMVGSVYLVNVVDQAASETSDVARNAENDKVDVSFGGLTITNASITPMCGTTFVDADFTACDEGTTVAFNDDKDTATITVDTNDNSDNIRLSGVRLDVSGLDVDDGVAASLSSAGAGGINFGSGAGVSAARHVATVKEGISFDISHANQLYCSGEGASQPSLEVSEGFASAWEADLDGTGLGSTMVHFKILNVPSGVTFIWPGQKHDDAESNPEARKNLIAEPAGGFTDDNGDNSLVATLEFVPAGLSTDTTAAVYKFVPMDYTDGQDLDGTGDGTAQADKAEDHGDRADTFEIKLVVAIDQAKAGAGGTADIWGWLHPEPGFEDRDTKLSYKMVAQTQDTNEDDVIDEDDGDILTVSECVTYLLYPFVTCGSTAGWSTGISVANTTMDDDVFGEEKGAAPQTGSVTLYGYPKTKKAADGSSGEAMDPVMEMLSPNLAAGDTISAACPMVMEGGWEGYAIVRAGFRHAHGMAFVMGDFPDGAGVDVAHGYIALVIPDPQFTEGERGTAISESLGQ